MDEKGNVVDDAAVDVASSESETIPNNRRVSNQARCTILGFAHDGIILQPPRRMNPTSKDVNIHILVVVVEVVVVAVVAPIGVVPIAVKRPQRYPTTNTRIPNKRRENQTRLENIVVAAADGVVTSFGVVIPECGEEKRGK